MVRIVITAQVDDSAKWEQGFRTHGELLRSMGSTAVYFCTTDKNEVAVYSEATDLAKYMEMLESPAVAEAMAHDGVKPDTVKIFVLDKESRF
jgi:hypothetical protein